MQAAQPGTGRDPFERTTGAGRLVERRARGLVEAVERLLPDAWVEVVAATPTPVAPYVHVSRAGRGGPVRVVLLDAEDVPAAARFALSTGHPLVQHGRRDDRHVLAVPLRRPGADAVHPADGSHGTDGTDGAADGAADAVVVARRPPTSGAFAPDDVEALGRLTETHLLRLENALLVEQLSDGTSHDPLTGLANRHGMHHEIERALAERRASGTGVAVLVLGLDGFRDVNAALGHRNGDALLVHVADALLAALPIGGRVARVAGDEFAVLLTGHVGTERAEALAARLRDAVAAATTIDGVEVQARSSAGIAVAHPGLDDVRALLGAADSALAQAKRGALGVVTRVAVNPGTGRSAAGPLPDRASMTTLADLRRALRGEDGAGRVDVHLQPQAGAASGEVVGVEALVRWEHPDRGLLGPADFLGIADRHGLTLELTEVVLDRAVRAAVACRAAGHDLTVSVNLSARALVAQWLVPTVTATLTEHGLPSQALTLEITEDSMISDPEHAVTLLDDLRAIGVRLSVDDFGTGYSSLSYLSRLPVDEVKIDKSFLATGERTSGDGADLVIARSIVDLARNLGLDTVAEGVEDDSTWDRLAVLGCGLVQGFGLARPMPLEALQQWLLGYRSQRAATGPERAAEHPVTV